MNFVLIPFRGLDGAKQRLRDILSPDERISLAWTMLEDVIDAISASATSPRILVVTQNPSAARAFVSSDIVVIADPGQGGLNAAVERGFGSVAESVGPEALVLTIPADLPLLRPATVDRAFVAMRENDTLVLAPALTDGGTNLFGQSAACRVAPSFGSGSFRVHAAAAAQAGVAVHVIEDVGVGCDIDRRDDLLALAALSNATRSVRFARACIAAAP